MSRMTWDQDDTEILVQCWAEVQRRFKATPRITGKKKILKPKGTELWREITQKVNVLVSIERKPSQVESKMRKIIDAYKDVKIINSKSGNEPVTCPYFEILEEISGTRDNIVPKYVVESNVLPKESNSESSKEADDVGDDDESEKGDENADDDGGKENEPALAKKKKQDPCNKVKKKKNIEKEGPLVTIMGESLQLMKSNG